MTAHRKCRGLTASPDRRCWKSDSPGYISMVLAGRALLWMEEHWAATQTLSLELSLDQAGLDFLINVYEDPLRYS